MFFLGSGGGQRKKDCSFAVSQECTDSYLGQNNPSLW